MCIGANKIETEDEKIDFNNSYFPYRELIGSILCVANKTRPDIAFAVNFCSRRVEKPTKQDVINGKRILRYLLGTSNSGIKFYNSNLHLEAYCDADYANDPHTRKSTTGYIIFLCGGPITWSSRQQPIVAISSSESEYIAAADCCRELMYLKFLISEVVNEEVNATLYVDNQSTIHLINNGIMIRRPKHIDVRYHYIHEKVSEGLLKIKYCPSEHQIADILTKPLGNVKFSYLKSYIIS
ncbi:uncharacterized protein LOC131849635 [Achroia grisella]|uniref:uncharacterized protein LOC131849635 n=1 Tax=Achroia grisella TaxID=688607 RepID=UPI0027D263A9|nr:uncharacterized protein LOC131849635 [Achroia grisella]